MAAGLPYDGEARRSASSHDVKAALQYNKWRRMPTAIESRAAKRVRGFEVSPRLGVYLIAVGFHAIAHHPRIRAPTFPTFGSPPAATGSNRNNLLGLGKYLQIGASLEISWKKAPKFRADASIPICHGSVYG